MNQQQNTVVIDQLSKRIISLEQQVKQLQSSNRKLRDFRRQILGIVEKVKGNQSTINLSAEPGHVRKVETPHGPLYYGAVSLADLLKR